MRRALHELRQRGELLIANGPRRSSAPRVQQVFAPESRVLREDTVSSKQSEVSLGWKKGRKSVVLFKMYSKCPFSLMLRPRPPAPHSL